MKQHKATKRLGRTVFGLAGLDLARVTAFWPTGDARLGFPVFEALVDVQAAAAVLERQQHRHLGRERGAGRRAARAEAAETAAFGEEGSAAKEI